MGLDVIVCTGPLEPWTPTTVGDDVYDEAYEAGAFKAGNANGFGRTAPLEPGAWYVRKSHYRFHGGSYGGYNAYREWLCGAVLGVEPDVVWGSPEQFKGKPFYEQIHFGDNEDTIGAAACKRLAADYETHAHLDRQDLADWRHEKFGEWRKAFKLAAETDGAVDFR